MLVARTRAWPSLRMHGDTPQNIAMGNKHDILLGPVKQELPHPARPVPERFLGRRPEALLAVPVRSQGREIVDGELGVRLECLPRRSRVARQVVTLLRLRHAHDLARSA